MERYIVFKGDEVFYKGEDQEAAEEACIDNSPSVMYHFSLDGRSFGFSEYVGKDGELVFVDGQSVLGQGLETMIEFIEEARKSSE